MIVVDISIAPTEHYYSEVLCGYSQLIPIVLTTTISEILRTGHYVGLRAYQYRIKSGVPDQTCQLCGEEDRDLEQWLTRRPATAARRWELFGGGYECPDSLSSGCAGPGKGNVWVGLDTHTQQ